MASNFANKYGAMFDPYAAVPQSPIANPPQNFTYNPAPPGFMLPK